MRSNARLLSLSSGLLFCSRSFISTTKALKLNNNMASSTTTSRPAVSIRSTFDNLRSNPKETFILDGGTGEELFRRGVPDDRKLWSATCLVHEQYHKTLEEVHKSFLESGSNAVTTNSYGVIPGVGFNPEEISKYMDIAGNVARDAVTKYQQHSKTTTTKPCFVFGSLGPLIESYRADMIKPHDEGVQDYKLACQSLYPYVDAFLAETMSCIEESIQVIEAVEETIRTSKSEQQQSQQPHNDMPPMLISYTLDSNGNFRDGQSVVEGLNQLLDYYCQANRKVELLAVMFNCAEPEAITAAFSRIRSNANLTQRLQDSHLLLGAYANRLTAVDPNWTLAESEAPQPFRKDLDCQHYYDGFVKDWIDRFGVQLVGGCCGITPEHIQVISDELRKRKQM